VTPWRQSRMPSASRTRLMAPVASAGVCGDLAVAIIGLARRASDVAAARAPKRNARYRWGHLLMPGDAGRTSRQRTSASSEPYGSPRWWPRQVARCASAFRVGGIAWFESTGDRGSRACEGVRMLQRSVRSERCDVETWEIGGAVLSDGGHLSRYVVKVRLTRGIFRNASLTTRRGGQ